MFTSYSLVFGRPFLKQFALCYRTIVCLVLSICDGVLWPNDWTYQDATWHGARPQRRPHCVRCGPSCPPQKGAQQPSHLSAHVCCGQSAGCIKMPLGMEVGLGPGHIVLGGDRAAPLQKGGHSPQFSAHVFCWQTAGWIKMPLGTETGLGPRDIVLDCTQLLPTEKGTAAPVFSQCLLWPNGHPSQQLLSSCKSFPLWLHADLI